MNWREKWKKKWKYISNRVQVLGVLCLAALSISGAVQLAAAKTGADVLFTTGCLTLLAGAALAAAFWGWVVRPYREHEKVEKRFLAGYMFSEEDLERAVLTPTMREEMEMMEKIIRSPQLMDLNKRQAQYLALQNQINPHFLYNTLESIRGEALIAGLSGVADMTESLAKFFRYTITKVENLVSVEEELDNCETYFGIQKYRFGDRWICTSSTTRMSGRKITNCRIPKLTLQPILENSIIHGTELKIGEGNLWIRFRRTENRLVITISDDGVGMDEETLERLNETLNRGVDAITQQQEEKKGGIALANVNNRIHLIFGDEYGMHVYSMAECGTDVEISIPVVTRLEQKGRSMYEPGDISDGARHVSGKRRHVSEGFQYPD